ncbi:uncharacterized protein METZ01_LOCUS129084, partial [marine metagenome]
MNTFPFEATYPSTLREIVQAADLFIPTSQLINDRFKCHDQLFATDFRFFKL